MKSVEKPVVSKVELVSNLDYARPLDRLDEPVEITSQFNYIEPENLTSELGVFRDASGLVSKKWGDLEALPASFCQMMIRLGNEKAKSVICYPRYRNARSVRTFKSRLIATAHTH